MTGFLPRGRPPKAATKTARVHSETDLVAVVRQTVVNISTHKLRSMIAFRHS